ncbi:MAG: aminotransferase class I/II-fold pyridoxal phosphate-dependent enzyme [Acidimicrobiales bacterium]
MSDADPDPLGLGPEEMRRLGYWVVDQVVDHITEIGDGPALRSDSPDRLLALLGGPVPTEPGDPQAAMATLVEVALATMQHTDHPRFFTRVPGPSSYPAVLGEWLGTGFQAIAASWGGGAGPTAVELIVLDWLRTLLRLPDGAEGILLSGGSMANLTGLMAARHEVGDGVVYLSDQTHSSIGRGLAATGFAEIRLLPTDDRLRLGIDAVLRAVADDRAAGHRPAIVVATAGTTNTGAVDPLPELADLCAAEGLWLHVDGAYGAPAALAPSGRSVLAGLERADSVVLDPHKWLFQPYDIGVLLVRRPGALERAFTMNPEYLADIVADTDEVDLRSRSLELSRRARALKLWLTFRTYGSERIGQAIERGIASAEHVASVLAADPAWEIVTPAQLGIVTFARVGASDAQHVRAAADLTEDGFAAVSTTTLRGRAVLRLCTINPRTTEADLDETLTRLADLIS